MLFSYVCVNLQYCTFNITITDDSNEEKKEDIWLGPMTKAPTPPKNPKRNDNKKPPPETLIKQR